MQKYKNFYTKYINQYEIKGNEMVCICPFHEEKTASLHIDLVKGGFHCFGCEAHGNAREFLKRLEDINTSINFMAEEQPNIKISTMFDNTLYAEKPKGEEIGKIKNRIEKELQVQEYTLKDFISNFANGMTIIPAGIKSNAKTNWKSQQVFLLDFDNKDLDNYKSVEEVLEYSKQIGLVPTCIYNTFSSTEEVNKFRLVYVFKEPITDLKLAEKIITELFDKFKQFKPDNSKRNLADMFFGGKSIAFSSNIVYTAQVKQNIDISKEDFYNLPNEKMDHLEIAETLLKENHIILCNEDIYIYNNGVYTNSLQIVKQKINEIYRKANKRLRDEVIEYLKIELENKSIDINKNYINFKNGLYSIKDKKLIPHSANIFTINQLPINYNKSVKINADIEKFLNTITCNKLFRKETILQIIGYSMTASVDFQKAFIFYGETAANGKSTLLEVINRLIGIDNICHVSIHNMQGKFYTNELQNSLLNSVAELSSLTVQNTEVLKEVITGDRISTEKKNKDRKKTKVYAKNIFTTNVLPKILNAGNDFYRRFNILLFEAQFTEEEKANFNIENLLTTEALEYLAVIAVEAYLRLLKENKFANEQESNMLLGVYELENNSVLEFLNDTDIMLEITDNGKSCIYKPLLFTEYQKWCTKYKKDAVGRNTFYKQVEKSKLFKTHTSGHNVHFEYLGEDEF